MNIRKRFTISLALTALAAALTATQASAQPVLKGSFDLPGAAYWGDALLQPGHYNISMSAEVRSLQHIATIRVSGEGVSRTFLASSKRERESGRSYLEIADLDGTYVVRAFNAGMLGRSFPFGVTRRVREQALRAGAGPAIAVPVSSDAGF